MHNDHHLITQLKRLRLPAIAENLQLRQREAEENALGYLKFLTLLVTDELSNREANILAKRITSGNINPRLTFESFDLRFNNTALPSQTIRDLASCHFCRTKPEPHRMRPTGNWKNPHLECHRP